MIRNLYLVNTSSGKSYHAGLIADRIAKKFEGIRECNAYAETSDLYFDLVSACDREELRGWMGHYMREALDLEAKACKLMATALAVKDTQQIKLAVSMTKESAVQFIVAYDMYV